MMNQSTLSAAEIPESRIAAVIEQYGAWHVLRLSVRALLRRPRPGRRREADDLSDHLRRDIGLAPHASGADPWPRL